LNEKWASQIDHAARNETSQVLAIRPDLVKLGNLSNNREEWPQGVSGSDPRDATNQYGEACFERSLELLGEIIAAANIGNTNN
jgi:creatinine amidohydrolase